MRPPIDRRRFLGTAAAGVAALAVVGVPALARAAEVEVQVTLGRAQIEVGQSVYLQVEVSTEGQAIPAPRFVGLDQVAVTSRGTSSGLSVEYSGGRSVRRSTKTFTYVLTPRTAGEHPIKVELEIAGQVYRPATTPKLIATGDDYEPELEHDKASDAPDTPDAEVIVWPVVDKATAYVGEQIIYELQIWERARGNLTIAAAPTFKDFWSEDLQTPEQQQQQRRNTQQRMVGGVPYRVHETMRRALFPQKAGTLTIGGPEVQLQELSGPFFGGSGPPQSYMGRGLAIEVRPLPTADRPTGFRPNSVGQFRISAEVDRAEVIQGEAVRLSLRISGTGNIALIELPEPPPMQGMRSYEPKPETPKFELGKAKLQGSRVYTMLVIADEAGELEIPAFELPYFDPEAGEYRVAKSKPIKLAVEADPDATPSAEPVAKRDDDSNRGDDELLAPAIASDTLPRVTPRERWLTPKRWWLASLSAPAVLGLGWLGTRLRARFGPDDDARARNQELARRRALLNEANAAVDSGEGFYPSLASLLQAAAVLRAGPDGVGLTRERLMALLDARGVAAEEVAQLRELLDACDAARFGAGSGEVAQRREHLERARALLGRRSWRRA
ncbi:BatD protein [Enhygromyxa salina]|uniref:BatD protein n=1 Tax=Enhygromyxa salina TaxID=215803 RepID=A0A0C1ZKS6_9BACT|nr:BatD family protein [Enhygromyxa salina]KIG18129.1 BatD protein [Enhygromyxa salina]